MSERGRRRVEEEGEGRTFAEVWITHDGVSERLAGEKKVNVLRHKRVERGGGCETQASRVH